MKSLTRHMALAVMAVITFITSSCDTGVFFADDYRIDEEGWNMAETVDFEVDVNDSVSFYDFLIELRINNDYAYSNLFLFVDTSFPDGSVAHDTLGCLLADPRTGEWFGKQSGFYISERIPFHKNVRFYMPGKYHFEIRHGMREDDIRGIRNVGLRIEHVK